MKSQERTLLIIEDDQGLQNQLKWHFDDFDTTIVTVSDREAAIAAVRQYEPKVIIQDLGLPPDPGGVEEGFRCIQSILALSSRAKIIVLTGKRDRKNALRSIDLGAFDFYLKPIDSDDLNHVVDRAFKITALEEDNLRRQSTTHHLTGIIAGDPAMLSVCRMVEKVAPTEITCTLLGESGTGKEVLARAIHNLSKRAPAAFVAINCAAVPETLMESELFGYEKGAFTGANKLTEGKIESAAGGTLFLDEVGDMPLMLQAKLLRFLQERTIERVGGRVERPVDLRVICATNKDLEAMVRQGEFREDLYYRISEMVIDIPPLRDRGGDKMLMARHLLEKYAVDNFAHVSGFANDAVSAIEAHAWPGNVREMENKIKRAIILAETKQISSADLGLQPPGELSLNLNLREVRQGAERAAILHALALTGHNVSASAKLLGITRPTLYDMMKKYTIGM